MNPTTIAVLSLIISPILAALGSYVGVRVTLARLEERNKAQDETLTDYGERIKHLERAFHR